MYSETVSVNELIRHKPDCMLLSVQAMAVSRIVLRH